MLFSSRARKHEEMSCLKVCYRIFIETLMNSVSFLDNILIEHLLCSSYIVYLTVYITGRDARSFTFFSVPAVLKSTLVLEVQRLALTSRGA